MNSEELGKLVKDYHAKQEARDTYRDFLRDAGESMQQLGLALTMQGVDRVTVQGTCLTLPPRQGERNAEAKTLSLDDFKQIIDALEQMQQLARELAHYDETLREAGYANMVITRRPQR